MVFFLTSSFIEYKMENEPGSAYICRDYEFVSNLKKYWREKSRILLIAADPDDIRVNDINFRKIKAAFVDSGLKVSDVTLLDRRNLDNVVDLIKKSDVVILTDGHAPTQNRFFRETELKTLLQGYPGILIAMGSGSINCAENAYIYPEFDGETEDPEFERFTKGLGLTDMCIIPHSSYLKHIEADGKNLIDDIIYPDSKDHKFYLVEDGSYFLIDDDVIKFYGKGDMLENGAYRSIDTRVSESDWDAIMTSGYISVFEIDIETWRLFNKYTSLLLKKYDVSVSKSETFDRFIKEFASKLLVDSEKNYIIEQSTTERIEEEIRSLGSYSRTVHCEKSGFRRSFDIRIKTLKEDKTRYICIIFDTSEIVDRDWMTDILSRSGFLRDAEKCLKDLDLSEGYSLIYTNIRGFKTINDLFGEESGDDVIFMVRDRIKSILDPLVFGRLESDHFVAIVRNELLKSARIRKITQMTYRSIYKMYDFNVTCGIYPITDSGISVGLMIDRAKLAEKNLAETDTAMYSEYTDKMRSDYVNQMIMISDLSEALRRRELVAYYQPIVDARTHKVVSAESLIRWNHRDLGMVSPGLFIPALEASGKVSRVDLYMAETVFGMLLRDSREGLPIVPVSINLSRVDFYDPTLLERINEILEEKDFPVGAAKIEITESAYANLEKNALDFLRGMKEKHVRILLDDYGSGMSSLSTLESYEFNTIKLDLGFIRKIGSSDRAETIIRSTISMAHAFGADVIAEGVENEQQLAFLSDAGVDMIQGFYFYKPMSEEDFRDIMNNPNKTDMMITWGKDTDH